MKIPDPQTVRAQRDRWLYPEFWQSQMRLVGQTTGSSVNRYVYMYEVTNTTINSPSADLLNEVTDMVADALKERGWFLAGKRWQETGENIYTFTFEVSLVNIPLQLQEQTVPGDRKLNWLERLIMWWRKA